MKYLTLTLLLLVLSACTFAVRATPQELAAYNAMVATREAQTPALPTTTPGPDMSPEAKIKVNRSADGTLIYHMPGQASYERTIIEPAKGEFFAETEQEAIDAGARKSLR